MTRERLGEYDHLLLPLEGNWQIPHPPATRTTGPSGWSSDNIPFIRGVRELLRAMLNDHWNEINFWIDWLESALSYMVPAMGYDEGPTSRTYGHWPPQSFLPAEIMARAAGAPDLASELVSYMAAYTGVQVWASNGSKPRKIRDHGKPDPASQRKPVIADGAEIRDRGIGCASVGPRSWVRSDDDDPGRDRDDDFLHLDYCGAEEWLGFHLAKPVHRNSEIVRTFRACQQLASELDVSGPWTPAAGERELLRSGLENDPVGLHFAAGLIEGWATKFDLEILRTAENGVICLYPHAKRGSTSGCGAGGQFPDGVRIFVAANSGRRKPQHARAFETRLVERDGRRFAVSTSDEATVEGLVPSGEITSRLILGPGFSVWIRDLEPEDPPDDPPGGGGDPEPPPAKPPKGDRLRRFWRKVVSSWKEWWGGL